MNVRSAFAFIWGNIFKGTTICPLLEVRAASEDHKIAKHHQHGGKTSPFKSEACKASKRYAKQVSI